MVIFYLKRGSGDLRVTIEELGQRRSGESSLRVSSRVPFDLEKSRRVGGYLKKLDLGVRSYVTKPQFGAIGT